MQQAGFKLTRKSDGVAVLQWINVPARIEADNLRVDGADANWSNDDYQIEATTWEVADPVPAVPQIISDRQFFQRLAVMGVITQNEALAAVGPGTIPAALVALVGALPSEQQFAANMLLTGATQFDRTHQMVAVFGQAFGWNDTQLDDLWTAAALL